MHVQGMAQLLNCGGIGNQIVWIVILEHVVHCLEGETGQKIDYIYRLGSDKETLKLKHKAKLAQTHIVKSFRGR